MGRNNDDKATKHLLYIKKKKIRTSSLAICTSEKGQNIYR